MAFAFVVSHSDTFATANGGTTSGIDTTGADILFVLVSEYATGVGDVVSDSNSNTWVEILVSKSTEGDETLYYSINPTVGSGHTFTYVRAGSAPTIAILAFSGSDLTTPLDQQNSGTTSSSQLEVLSTGSVTPTTNGQLLITGIANGGDTTADAIDNGFTLETNEDYQAGGNMGGYSGYKIQATAVAINPQWSWTNIEYAATVIATFKAAASSATILPQMMHHLCG